MRYPRGSSAQSRVAIEVTEGHLHVAVIEPTREAAPLLVRTRTVAWRKEAPSLLGEAGRRELAAALASLATEEKLRGAKVYFVLDRVYCTTRVVTGPSDQVRREMEQIESRSARYLGLGHGPKAVAPSCDPLDARHDHALVAVANRRTLDALLSAAADAGLEVEAVGPSMVALSRLLGHAGYDADAPQLFATLTTHGPELGISHQGRLLLDYRPSGRGESDVAGIVGKHLNRLVRYCQHYQRHATGLSHDSPPPRIYLFGPADAVEAAREGFRRLGRLDAQAVELETIEARWRLEPATPSWELCPALGFCLGTAAGQPWAGPNFVEQIRAERRQPLLPVLLRSCWPVAAALLVAAVLCGWNAWERSCCNRLAAQIEELEPVRDQSVRLRHEIAAAEIKAGHLQRIQEATAMPPWSEVLRTVARCLPESVWLERIEANRRGGVALKGISHLEEGTYDLVRWLAAVPGFAGPQLEGMQPHRLPSGLATKFDIHFDLAGQGAPAKETGKHE